MSKEVLLYTRIDSDSAQEFIANLEASKDNDIVLRINTNGGEPEYTWGMIAKYIEFPKTKNIKVDGKAYSGGLYFLCYAEYVECLDVSEFLLHRAAYPSWLEKDYMTDAMWENLNRINVNLRKALEAKIDVAKFEKLKGVTLDQIFSNDSRVDVFLSANEAKQIGLVNKINKITPQKRAEINALKESITISFNEEKLNPEKNTKNMKTPESLKSEEPELYNKIIAIGAEAERDRIGAWMTFVDVDPETVKKGVSSGKAISQTEAMEFMRKSVSKESLKNLETDSPGTVTTKETDPNKSEKQKSIEAFENKIDTVLNLKS